MKPAHAHAPGTLTHQLRRRCRASRCAWQELRVSDTRVSEQCHAATTDSNLARAAGASRWRQAAWQERRPGTRCLHEKAGVSAAARTRLQSGGAHRHAVRGSRPEPCTPSWTTLALGLLKTRAQNTKRAAVRPFPPIPESRQAGCVGSQYELPRLQTRRQSVEHSMSYLL